MVFPYHSRLLFFLGGGGERGSTFEFQYSFFLRIFSGILHVYVGVSGVGAARGIINSKIHRAITWPDKSFKENVFLLEKIVGSAHVLSTKGFFSLDRIQIKYWYGEKEKKGF